MKTLVRLCISVARKNRGFTAGIFIMSVLTVAIAFLGANLGAGSSDTLNAFLIGSNIPDALFVTDVMPDGPKLRLEAVPGVKNVSAGFIYDTLIEAQDGSLFSVRLFRQEEDGAIVHTVHEALPGGQTGMGAAISSDFAEYNGIRPGDVFTVSTPSGRQEIVIEAVISNPETLNCVKDAMSSYESTQFAYVYLRCGDFDTLFPTAGLANRWQVWFDKNLSPARQTECMRSIRELLGAHIREETLTEESEALQAVRDDLSTIGVLCSFIPGVIGLIALGFNFIFIRIIVLDQKKTVGLLRALGYPVKKVVQVFVLYTVLINAAAVLLGVLIGDLLLHTCLSLLSSANGILNVIETILPLQTLGMLLLVFMIGILAALMSAGAISRVDPAEAYGGIENVSPEPPRFLSRLKSDAFFKISLGSMLRHFKRQIVGALCIAACIILMCVGIEGILSIGYPIDAVYGGRFSYDLMARGLDSATIARVQERGNGVDDIRLAEPAVFFSARMLDRDVRVAAVTGEEQMTAVTDMHGKRLSPGDGVIIDEMTAILNGLSVGDALTLDETELPITGIAREILFPVMYVSPETAEKLGHSEPGSVLIRLTRSAEIDLVERQIAALCPDAYFARFVSQKEDIRSSFAAMRTVMGVFAVLAFLIGSLLILNITVIDFNEGRSRYAALRALGTPVKRLGKVAAIQNLLRTAAGIVIALPLCRVCITVLLRLLSGASQQYVMVRYEECLILSCLISLLYVVIGTAIALIKIRSMDFTACLNEVE